MSALSLFDGDESVEPTVAEVTAAYALLLREKPPVRSCDAAQVGVHKAEACAQEFARKDVKRYLDAVSLAKAMRKERVGKG